MAARAPLSTQICLMPEANSVLTAWESFYVIIGSSAGALTGLQFVVIALIADTRGKANQTTIDTFATPTIVHFCVVLLTSAMLSSPWPTLHGAAIGLGVIGTWGLGYTFLVLRRTFRVKEYRPVMEDWIWHITLPFVSYAVFLVAAFTLDSYRTVSLFFIGGMNLLLLFIGIHNAWDTVTFLVTGAGQSPENKPTPVEPSAPAIPARPAIDQAPRSSD